MYIKSITIENFKGFISQKIRFNEGLNVFVGENNTGKTTVFEAIDYLWNGKGKVNINDIKNKRYPNRNGYIEIEISGLSDELKKEEKYIKDDSIILKREISHKENTLTIYNNQTHFYEKKFPNAIKNSFDIDFLWADTHPSEITKYTSTSIVGKLVSKIVDGIYDEEEYANFERTYNKVFNGPYGLSSKLNSVALEMKGIFGEQFGDVNINFGFSDLDRSYFTKNITINVNDGTETSIEGKGTGMQRGIALALLQLYANKTTSSTNTPFFIFIDEPEVSLHPNAQKKLAASLHKISLTQQLFISTHSPYILKGLGQAISNTLIFSKVDGKINITKIEYGKGLFGMCSPTLGEINFYAYKLPTEEFHDELYGELCTIACNECKRYQTDEGFNQFLHKQLRNDLRPYIKINKDGTEKKTFYTIQTYIRNLIHHPENHKNEKYTEEELEQSIKEMVELLHSLQAKPD